MNSTNKPTRLNRMFRRFTAIAIFLTITVHTNAQTAANDSTPYVRSELFCGVDLNYADVNFMRLYNLLINLTPGFKLHVGEDWQFAVQAWLPVMNDGYNKRYDLYRLNMAVASKEFHFDEIKQHFKASAGLFSRERWGADLKWMYPLTNWLLLNAQTGVTKHWTLAADLHSNYESDFDGDWVLTGTVGANVYLTPWDTECRISGGRYINKDYGVQFEVMRHFRHTTVTAFAEYHEKGDDKYSRQQTAGGFKVIVMLPPYKDNSKKKFVVRPASNFRLTYIAQSDGVSMRTYNTDPEENERVLPMRVAWGTGNLK